MVNLADFFFVSWLVCLWTTFFSDKTRFTCWTSVSSYRIRCAWHKTLQLLQLNFLLQPWRHRNLWCTWKLLLILLMEEILHHLGSTYQLVHDFFHQQYFATKVAAGPYPSFTITLHVLKYCYHVFVLNWSSIILTMASIYDTLQIASKQALVPYTFITWLVDGFPVSLGHIPT